MGFTAFLVMFVFVLFVMMIKGVIDGAKAKNWRKVVIVAVIFLLRLHYYGLDSSALLHQCKYE